jgi:hypothetical protein
MQLTTGIDQLNAKFEEPGRFEEPHANGIMLLDCLTHKVYMDTCNTNNIS